MSVPFYAARLKLKRARKHLADLAEAVEEWRASDPITNTITHSEASVGPWEGNTRTLASDFKGTTAIAALPEALPVIIGDVIHNARSALDLMASECAKQNGKSPNGVRFPFSKVEEDFEKRLQESNFRRGGDAALRLVRELRPFPTGNPALRALHDLDLKDKHQELISDAAWAADLFQFRFDKMPPYLEFNPDLYDSLTLVMPAGVFWEGKPLVGTMEHLLEVAEGVVEAFAALYPVEPSTG